MSVTFHTADRKLSIHGRTDIKVWLDAVARKEQKRIGHIAYVFCSDKYLLNINRQFLEHDTYTDIITFDYSEGRVLGGEVYISLDRVKENASTFGVSFKHELCRVMVHGLLHLCGYNDKQKTDQQGMRQKEDKYLALLQA